MDASPSHNFSAEAVLDALSRIGSDAWCFAPIDHERVTYCSRSFIHAWGFDFIRVTQEGYTCFFRDDNVADRLEVLGFGRDWLDIALKSSASQVDDLPTPFFADELTRIVLSDEEGRPSGVLLVCKNASGLRLSNDVYSQAVESKALVRRLSPRETEILELVFEGYTNKAVAAKSGISEKTVEKHRSNIMRKVGARSIAELIRRVTEAKLVRVAERES